MGTCVIVGALAAPVDDTDPFIALIQNLEIQPFFKALSDTDRVLTFEMLTAAETNNLAGLLDELGYVLLLKYLDALPKDFSHRFITYSIEHLEKEAASKA